MDTLGGMLTVFPLMRKRLFLLLDLLGPYFLLGTHGQAGKTRMITVALI